MKMKLFFSHWYPWELKHVEFNSISIYDLRMLSSDKTWNLRKFLTKKWFSICKLITFVNHDSITCESYWLSEISLKWTAPRWHNAFVTSTFDYENFLRYDLPNTNMIILQVIRYIAAKVKLITSATKRVTCGDRAFLKAIPLL